MSIVSINDYKNHDNLQKSFVTQTSDELICHVFEKYDLIKGRRANDGEIRNWSGKDYKKVGGRWIPVNKKSEDPDVKPIFKHAEHSTEAHLRHTIANSKDPDLRHEAKKELERRETEEGYGENGYKKKPSSPKKKVEEKPKVENNTAEVTDKVNDFIKNFNAESELGINMKEAMVEPGMCSAVSNELITHLGQGTLETHNFGKEVGVDDSGAPISDHTAVKLKDGTIVDITIGQFDKKPQIFIGSKDEWIKKLNKF